MYGRLVLAFAVVIVLATLFSGYYLAALVLAVVLGILLQLAAKAVRNRRSAFIDAYLFHPAVINKFRGVRTNLTPEQEERVFSALRDYFQLCLMAGRSGVAMPSQVVDDAWHAFILYTRSYEQFCSRALGRFLHHTPAEAMRPGLAHEGIRRAWRLACSREGIDPKHPAALPLLFAIDRELHIENGFFYVPDCSSEIRRSDAAGNYCAAHIGCSSGCAGDAGGDCGSDSGSGDGGGCGGD